MLEKILIFIVFLGPLVFFHELGHFLFARLFGVRVEIFSLGFGPKLFRFRKGDTEYALSLIPLGGYVKMFGDDPLAEEAIPEEEKKYAFTQKGKWARFWIVFGGPLANFILAFFIFLFLLLGGEKVPQAKFGSISENSFFHTLGIQSGAILKKINDQEILGLTDINLHEDEKIYTVEVQQSNGVKTFSVNLTFKEFMEEFIKYPPRFRLPLLINAAGDSFVILPKDRPRDFQISLEEIAITYQNLANESEILFTLLPLKKLSVEGDFEGISEKDVDLTQGRDILLRKENGKDIFNSLREEGLFPLDLQVSKVVKDSPADKVGLKSLDIVTSIQGEFPISFEDLRTRLQKYPEKEKVQISILREGKEQTVSMVPEVRIEEGQKLLTMGVYSIGRFQPIPFVEAPSKGLLASLVGASKRTWETIVNIFVGFQKLITQEASFKNIGGPLAIGKVASDSFHISLSYFFKLMAVISVNLGIINLFPIPVLDGGHLMFLGFEVLNRGPLSRRKIEIAQQFGVSLLFVLIFAALYNDVSRLF